MQPPARWSVWAERLRVNRAGAAFELYVEDDDLDYYVLGLAHRGFIVWASPFDPPSDVWGGLLDTFIVNPRVAVVAPNKEYL